MLRLALAGLRDEFADCGMVEGFDVLVAVMARASAACQVSAPLAQVQDAPAMQLQVWARQLRAAVGPGRDGADWACLYGHDDRLDIAIDAMRRAAAARILRQDGLLDARAQAVAQALVDRERRIALAKLDILRILAPSQGFVPPLYGLRITPALVQGLSRANPAATQRAGVLLGVVLADEQALSCSPEAQCMVQALRARMQASPCADDRAWIERRTKALQPQAEVGPAIANIVLQGAESAVAPALLQELAARGLTGLEEVQRILGSASRVLAPLRRHLEHPTAQDLVGSQGAEGPRPPQGATAVRPPDDRNPVALPRFLQSMDELRPGMDWTWKLNSQFQATSPMFGLPSQAPTSPLYVQVGALFETEREVQVSCDEDGCELALLAGRRLTGEMGMEATLCEPWPARLEMGAVAAVAAGGRHSEGVVLRFSAGEAGRRDLKQLLNRLIESGRIDLSDFKGARQVMPVLVQEKHATAHGGIKLDMALAGLDVALPGSAGAALEIVPALEPKIEVAVQSTTTSAQNSCQQIREHRRDFTLMVESESGPEVRATGPGVDAIVPLPGVAAEGAAFRCNESFHHELHGDRVAAATQRLVRVTGPLKLLARAVERCGGVQLRAVASYLRTSGRVEHRELQEAMANVLGRTAEGDEVRIVWRIAPQARAQASDLLREALRISAGQAGHTGMNEAAIRAARLREQVWTLLDDPACYHLHALERMVSMTAAEKLGSNANLLIAKWGTLAQVSQQRRSLRVVFEPTLVGAAFGDVSHAHLGR